MIRFLELLTVWSIGCVCGAVAMLAYVDSVLEPLAQECAEDLEP